MPGTSRGKVYLFFLPAEGSRPAFFNNTEMIVEKTAPPKIAPKNRPAKAPILNSLYGRSLPSDFHSFLRILC
ncbi:MAG: hypothetical protein ACREDR_36965, partial [Blastocatellia bacterium]